MRIDRKGAGRGLMIVAGVATFVSVLAAPRPAMSTTNVYRSVSVCPAATNESPQVTVIPGWACGLQAGSDANGQPISGQLSSVYFDYFVFNSTPTVRLCVSKSSFTGSVSSDCMTPAKPGTFPTNVDQFVLPNNVKQNAAVWDYVRADILVSGDTLYADYTPMDVRPIGVMFITAY